MTKQEYQKALNSPKWKAKRKLILIRDNYTCLKCGCKNNLHIHHKYYIKDKMPWEVPNDCLITLCKNCHEKEHEGRNISTFIRKSPPKLKKSKNKTAKKIREKESLITTPKIKKKREYNFIALKSKTLNEIYNKTTDSEQIVELAKSLNGQIKGFDDKNLAEHWLRQNQAGKAKKSKKKSKKYK